MNTLALVGNEVMMLVKVDGVETPRRYFTSSHDHYCGPKPVVQPNEVLLELVGGSFEIITVRE